MPLGVEREDGSKRVGFYRITERGIAFIEGLVTIEKYAYVYNNECLMMDAETKVHIGDAAGKGFDFREILDVGGAGLVAGGRR